MNLPAQPSHPCSTIREIVLQDLAYSHNRSVDRPVLEGMDGEIAAHPLPFPAFGRVETGDRVRDLVDRAVDGDAEAFGGLYDQFSGAVYRYFYHHVGSSQDAEDLVSRTFVKAWRSLPRFRWRGKPFEAWLFTVARNQLIDFLREGRPRRQEARLEAALVAGHADQRPGPEAAALASAEASSARAALERLTFEQREVIVLKFYLGHENREIAAIMGKREGTVRALQMRALAAMRRHLSDV